MKHNRIIMFFLMILSTHACADIYMCTNDSGIKTYFNFPKEGCKKLSLDPATPGKLTKKQQDQQKKNVEKDRLEFSKLMEELRQAKIGSVVECKGEKNCKKAFALTQIYITQHSDMKLQIATDVVLETYNPTDAAKLAIKATKTPRNGDTEKIELHVSCNGISPLTSRSCLRREIEAYKQFRPFVESSLL